MILRMLILLSLFSCEIPDEIEKSGTIKIRNVFKPTNLVVGGVEITNDTILYIENLNRYNFHGYTRGCEIKIESNNHTMNLRLNGQINLGVY